MAFLRIIQTWDERPSPPWLVKYWIEMLHSLCVAIQHPSKVAGFWARAGWKELVVDNF
jgi:hypothetical protein